MLCMRLGHLTLYSCLYVQSGGGLVVKQHEPTDQVVADCSWIVPGLVFYQSLGIGDGLQPDTVPTISLSF